MRLITRKILELRERKKREAELRQANATLVQDASRTRQASSGAAPAAVRQGLAVPPSPRLAPMSPGLQAVSGMGISPFLRPQMGGLDEGSQSPHLSQLGSPRLGPLF
ncbi:hypothetical protein P389DRAFT_166124 [Cystobasidium minutum MCA 4210]|uniref:uncharacterized protein n=1 Tax=Cystobasidium minutum MCA 4210 TaxID=1397322 RepID=UPI0034CD4D16|eukprot:jgi/Rhomi1/166124/fgenesh1_kg.1_\